MGGADNGNYCSCGDAGRWFYFILLVFDGGGW